MTHEAVQRTVFMLYEGDPSYSDLVDRYHELVETSGESAGEEVSRYALAQVLNEVVDYLDFISEEFEKSIGLTRTMELDRILSAFSVPDTGNQIEQIGEIIGQWHQFERYSLDDLRTAVEYGEARPLK